jgi:hypothetical protein
MGPQNLGWRGQPGSIQPNYSRKQSELESASRLPTLHWGENMLAYCHNASPIAAAHNSQNRNERHPIFNLWFIPDIHAHHARKSHNVFPAVRPSEVACGSARIF